MEGKQNEARYLMSKNNTPELPHAPVMKRRSLASPRLASQVWSSFFISAGADTQREVDGGFYNPSIMLLRDSVSHFICHGLVRHQHV